MPYHSIQVALVACSAFLCDNTLNSSAMQMIPEAEEPRACVQFLTNFLMWPFMALRADFTHKHDKDLEPTPAKVQPSCAASAYGLMRIKQQSASKEACLKIVYCLERRQASCLMYAPKPHACRAGT